MFVVPISNDTFENSIFPFTQSRTTGSVFSTIDDFCSKIFLIFFRDATADEILFTSQPSASTGHVQFLLQVILYPSALSLQKSHQVQYTLSEEELP